MLIKWVDYVSEIRNNAPPHSDSGYGIVMSGVKDADVEAIRKFLIREKQKCGELLWLLGDSSSDSCGCKKKTIKTGAVGRPKKIVKGKATDRHIHLFVLSSDTAYKVDQELSDIQTFLKKQRKKKPHLNQYKTTTISGMCYCKYIDRQSAHLHKCSNYDWDYFLSDDYME